MMPIFTEIIKKNYSSRKKTVDNFKKVLATHKIHNYDAINNLQ